MHRVWLVLNNLKTGIKLILGFIVVALLIEIVAVGGSLGMKRIDDNLTCINGIATGVQTQAQSVEQATTVMRQLSTAVDSIRQGAGLVLPTLFEGFQNKL